MMIITKILHLRGIHMTFRNILILFLFLFFFKTAFKSYAVKEDTKMVKKRRKKFNSIPFRSPSSPIEEHKELDDRLEIPRDN